MTNFEKAEITTYNLATRFNILCVPQFRNVEKIVIFKPLHQKKEPKSQLILQKNIHMVQIYEVTYNSYWFLVQLTHIRSYERLFYY